MYIKRFYIFFICTGSSAYNKIIFTTLKPIEFLKSTAVKNFSFEIESIFALLRDKILGVSA